MSAERELNCQSRAKYDKVGNAGIKGVHFQIDLLTVFMLNALEKPAVWRLSTENKVGSKFDDIIFECSRGVSNEAILLQAKHRKKIGFKITDESLFSVNSKNDDFSLPKYFFSYYEAKETLSTAKCSVKSVIICTNAEMELHCGKLIKRSLNSDDMLYFEGGDEICYTFQDDVIVRLEESIRLYHDANLRSKNISKDIICQENVQDFLSHLQFIAKYPSGSRLENIIEGKISCSKFGKCLNYKTASIFIFKEMVNWYEKEKGTYMDPISSRSIFCRMVSYKYCEQLEIHGIFFEHNDVIANNSKRIIHIIPQTEYLLYIIKVYEALLKEETLFIPPDQEDAVRLQIMDVFGLPQYKYLVIIRREPKTLNDDIYFSKLQSYLDCNKRIVLIAQKEDCLAKRLKNGYKNYYRKPNEHILFSDLKSETGRMFLAKTIIFQDETISIEKLLPTTDSRNRILSSDLLAKLARNETISIGKRISYLDTDNYIRRRFRRDIRNVGEDEIWKEDVVLISASAGMGKSTVLKKLATILKKEMPHLWVFVVDLNRCTQKLKGCKDGMDLINSQDTTQIQSDIEKALFSVAGSIALLIDGVDEISPDYTDVILKVLEDCKIRNNIGKLFVTTRPHLREELESKLEVKSWNLHPFSAKDQIQFLTKYWIKNLGIRTPLLEGKCKYYAGVLINNISDFTRNDPRNMLAGNPLQTRMLAEVFQENNPGDRTEFENWAYCKQYIESNNKEPRLPKKINFVSLYRLFIEKKRTIFIEEKGNPHRNVMAEEALKDYFNKWYDFHHILALRHILDPSYVNLFTCRINPVTTEQEENLLKVGIVERVGFNLCFVHRTFAEYFVAECITREVKHGNDSSSFDKFLYEIFVRYDFSTVRVFLDYFLRGHDSIPPTGSLYFYRWMLDRAIFSLSREGHAAILQFVCDHIRRKAKVDFLKRFRKAYNIDVRRYNGLTALHMAAGNGHLDVVKILVEKGANVNTVDNNGRTPLLRAVMGAHFDIVQYLIDKGAHINARDAEGSSPLLHASRIQDIPMVKYLLEKGADSTVISIHSITVLEHFIAIGDLELVKCVLQKGVDVNAKSLLGGTPLHNAVSYGNFDIMELLVARGADLNAICDGNWVRGSHFGWSELHRSREDDGEFVYQYMGGFAPLHLAVVHGDLRAAGFLLQKGAEVNITDRCGCTPLHVAVRKQDFQMVRVLVENGADLKRKDARGNTALQEAATLPEVFYFLLTRDAYSPVGGHKSEENCREEEVSVELDVDTVPVSSEV